MFKSIFSRLMLTYLILITVVIGIVSIVLTIGYSRYIFNGKEQEQLKSAKKVNRLVTSYLGGIITKQELDSSINAIGYVTDSSIYVIRAGLKSIQNKKDIKIGEGLDESFLINDLKQILNNKTVFHRNQYSSKFDMYVAFTGFPLKDENEIKGAILIFSPINEINRETAKINKIIWTSALILILISGILIYFISKKISKPIIQMTAAAEKLADGEKIEDINADSHDEIGKLADTFNTMHHQLYLTEKVRQEFIANVSHDLRTPLTSINGYVLGMIDGLIKPENYPKYLANMKEEINRLIKLSGNILEVAKIQGGAVKLNITDIKVDDEIRNVIQSMQILADEKKIQIILECPEDLRINADLDRFKQILLNLLSNAVKYSGEGSKVEINAFLEEGAVRFAVKDNGPGISEENVKFIFDKFYRGDKSRQNDGGTGLGLNIAKGLAELHGGRIWVESEVGKGTTFSFTMPQ